MERSQIHSEMTFITKSIEFSSSHYYYIEEWDEQTNRQKFGRCSDKNSHGHNYILHVTLKGLPSEDTGMIINLIDLKYILKDKVISLLDHKNLNCDVEYFKNKLPTTENIAGLIWNLLKPELGDSLACIKLEEDEDLNSRYKGEGTVYYITRIYRFSASHRLNNDNLSEEENLKIFGKCNNFNSHGHNFKLEVTLKGELDPVTGMVYDVLDMDNKINEKILSRFDHKNLNTIDELKGTITTGENLTKYIWNNLEDSFLPAKLHRIKLFETERNYFEYMEE